MNANYYYDALLPAGELAEGTAAAIAGRRLPFRALASVSVPADRIVVALVSDSPRLSGMFANNWASAAALHTQPLEFGPLRESIRTGLGGGAYPQLILRFGMVIQAAGSVRRPPHDVLSASGGEDTETAEE